MTRHPLPPDAARAARRYLAAFLPDAEVADAMHEVGDDAAFWGDDSDEAILRLAHAVLGSRARVTDEAAASAMVDLAGVAPDLAERVTGVTVGERAEDPAEDPVASPATAAPPAPGAGTPWTPATQEAGRLLPLRRDADGRPLRIGFEDDAPLPVELFEDPVDRRPWLLAAAVVLVLVAFVLLAT